MRQWILLLVTIFCVTGYAYGGGASNRTYQSRKLAKLYYQKTRKPQKAEKAIQQKVWDKVRRQYQYYARLGEAQAQKRIELGREVAKQQSQVDRLIPLKQSSALKNALIESSISTKAALQKRTEHEYLKKKSKGLRYENPMKPRSPIYDLKFRQY
ncbi:MAG: hypothetical protein HQM14_03260 [SAR324 cluster bacterium]|nr:hypothetical protein [SAR324 cluster bacterium]